MLHRDDFQLLVLALLLANLAAIFIAAGVLLDEISRTRVLHVYQGGKHGDEKSGLADPEDEFDEVS